MHTPDNSSRGFYGSLAALLLVLLGLGLIYLTALDRISASLSIGVLLGLAVIFVAAASLGKE